MGEMKMSLMWCTVSL